MRVLIVGNGPSLNETPLDDIKYDVSFGVNRIHLMYDKVKWRPDVWVLADRGSRDEEFVEDIKNNMCTYGYPSYIRVDIGRTELYELEKPLYDYPNYHPFCECPHNFRQNTHPLHWHLPHPCKYGGSLYVAVQIAVMKYDPSEIFFVGCDLGYKGFTESNHFADYYHTNATYTDKTARDVNKVLKDSHRIIDQECARRGISVYNATIGGELGEYPRIDVEELCK